MTASFVHLRLHSEYSLIDGLVRVKPLMKAVAAAGMPAVAITDQSNLFAMVKFHKAALAAGVKPIVGVDLWLANEQDAEQPYRMVLLCQNAVGYRNLTRLVSRSYVEGQRHGLALMQRSWLPGATEGLIALSGARQGDVGMALLQENRQQAVGLAKDWAALFPNRYYIELQRTGREREEDFLHAAVDLATELGLPVVATNDVRFIKSTDFEAHEARVCINEGRTLDDPRRSHRYTEQQYLRSPQEMAELFADIPEAIENTVEIAKRCSLELTLGKYFLPNFPVPAGLTMDEFFGQQSRDGLEARLTVLLDRNAPDFAERRKPYDERLEIELGVISRMGFAGYFLIVADFIRWAKQNDVPVGPGRGSGAGSLVAYALTITDLDPLQYDLLFERFLNPERVSMPDFDIDFCMEGRDRVIDYVANHYGRDQVSQIITYGTMAAKAVVRDVGRVLGYPYGFVDKLAKLIPFELGITLEKAIEQEPILKERYDKEEEVKALIDLARSLEGLTRNAGKHAGGVVIAPSALTDFTPLYCEEGGDSLVTQFDKDDVETIGLVKFDFLGLRTLTIIDWAVKAINVIKKEAGEPPIDITTIPLVDAKTFSLLKAHQTTAVFQLESRGMKDLIKRLQPDCFEDIIALVALFRPGPLQSGMVDDFINRKHGRAKIDYPHPALEAVLRPTYGTILYQEQVMQIAQVLAGYTLGGADMLRRAMGKKKPEEMAKQREIFVKGSLERGVKEATATHIFDLMEKFAAYGFNKSHSAAYALVSYQTAWLKAHYPAPFMAAVLSADMDNTEKVVHLVEECNHMGLKLTPPHVNHCAYAFSAQDTRVIRYGLGSLKGVGEAALTGIVQERNAKGEFTDLFDFCRRIDLRKVNRRALETLIRAGALDRLGPNRASLMESLTKALQAGEQHLRDGKTGQNDLFGFASSSESAQDNRMTVVPEWDEIQLLEAEKETLGLYLSGHPINRYEKELKNFVSCRIAELKPDKNQTVVIAGLIVGLRMVKTKKGDKMAIVTLDDRSGRIDMAVFSDMYHKNIELLAMDKLLVVSGEVALDDFSGGLRMKVKELFDIDHARGQYAKRLVITVSGQNLSQEFAPTLASALVPFKAGTCRIFIDYRKNGVKASLALGDEWRVRLSDELLIQLRRLKEPDSVELQYS